MLLKKSESSCWTGLQLTVFPINQSINQWLNERTSELCCSASRSVFDLVDVNKFLHLTDPRLLGWYLSLSVEDRTDIEGGFVGLSCWIISKRVCQPKTWPCALLNYIPHAIFMWQHWKINMDHISIVFLSPRPRRVAAVPAQTPGAGGVPALRLREVWGGSDERVKCPADRDVQQVWLFLTVNTVN